MPPYGVFHLPDVPETPRIHELKTWRSFFGAVWQGDKAFDARLDDRGYRAGDFLWLREWDANEEQYTGREIFVRVGYVLDSSMHPGLTESFVVLGFWPVRLMRETATGGWMPRGTPANRELYGLLKAVHAVGAS